MANEFKHKDPGSALTQAEFIASDGTGHIFDSQAAGDVLYASSTTVLARLAKATDGNVLELASGLPAWTGTPTIGSTSWSNANHAHGATNSGGTLNTSALGAGTLAVGRGGTGITSLGSNVATFLGTPSSSNLASAVTGETGSGELVFGTSPTLVTPALGTPASGVMTNVSGTAASLTAGAATALATARTIGGTSFDGTGNIAITTNANLTGVVTSSGNATAIADKALAIAKLADGTDGELITWNASGVIAAVAVGSADEVLTSNGSGAAPTFQAAAGGGQLVLIGECEAASSTTITVTGLSSIYDTYLILLSDINTSDNGAEVLLRLGHSGGIDSGATDYEYHTQDITTASASYAAFISTGASSILLGDVGNAAGEGLGATLWLHQPGDGVSQPLISGTVVHHATTVDPSGGMVIGARSAIITTTQIQLSLSGGTFASGRLTVLGVKHD